MGCSFPLRAFQAAALGTALVFGVSAPASERRLLPAQFEQQQSLSAGSILVAKEKLGDPNFAESVILIVQYDEDEGTMGVILNRQSDVPLSRVFPDIKHATADPVYLGGPVGTTVGQALLRLPDKADEATHVAGDVYATAAKKLIEKSVASRTPPSKFRLFLGYAGWAPGQLEAEVRLGAWAVLRGQSKIIFDNDPDSLWQRLIRETQWQMAKNGKTSPNGVTLFAVTARPANRGSVAPAAFP
ncbi:MAG TPA: YqgE/AlgH family protein [Bryobacteraceae bacterium]|jgi:putative transcriptional regulator